MPTALQDHWHKFIAPEFIASKFIAPEFIKPEPLAAVCKVRYHPRRMRLFPPTLALMLMASARSLLGAPPAPVDVPLDVRQAVIAHFSRLFVYPETPIWRYDSVRPYLLGGTLVCGHVNYQNSLRQYVGMWPFYLVVKQNGGVGDGGLMPRDPKEDPTGTELSTYNKVCHPAH